MVTLRRSPALSDLVDDAARAFVAFVSGIQVSGGGCHDDGTARVVLTGGGAGIGTLARVRELEESDPLIDWNRVHVYFGDERNVAADHPDSNEGQARAALLDHVGVPAAHIHGYGLGDVPMQEAADALEETIAVTAPEGFDLHLLGMGHEGHINSLFPHTDAVREDSRLVLAITDSPKPPAERVSLTLPAVRRADQVWLLVSGAEKAEAAGHVMRRSPAVDWPAAGAEGRRDTVLFLSDDAATAL